MQNRILTYFDKRYTYCHIAILLTVLAMVWYAKVGLQWWDFPGQQTICKYVIGGVNPYIPHSGAFLAQHHLPPIPYGWSTTPWGTVLGIPFYGGMLTLTQGQMLYLVMVIATYALFTLAVWKMCKQHRYAALVTCVLGMINYFRVMTGGNIGGMLCIFILFSAMLRDRCMLLSAICLALAMIKPQVALLFCLFLLYEKKYGVLLMAAAIDIAAWGIAAMLTHTSMLTLLHDFLLCPVGAAQHQFYGIATMLSPLLPDAKTTMYLSMLCGVSFAWLLRRYGIESFLLATTFWCYSFGNEFTILLPVVYMAITRRNIVLAAWASLATLICIFMEKLLVPLFADDARIVAMTAYLLILIAIYLWTLRHQRLQKIFELKR